MSLKGGSYVWEEGGKYFHSTAPYRQYGVEITFEEFAAKKLEGAEEAQDLSYTWQISQNQSWSTAATAITWSSTTSGIILNGNTTNII